ncbi:hypothetical protein C1I98_15410 [Spongiactinospora gelatinilytica]|uniref:Anti-sigma regulatory factor (Ser/Thr protein kinase) n=1 Tax=Spongiactinospora gelatinilytica TaxID=2666298 RepID=A0A2W2GSH8_9ACTN|nr:hypothetical protein [Spongiactinospora gelatinilytica]PZG45509.1 hypothetical protein C1I98_15410 [Spongiactinospora gelatinilytica]
MISGFRSQWPITSDLAAPRGRVRVFGTEAGLSGRFLEDLVIAANEAATNVPQHGGGGGGTLTAWCDGAGVDLEVVDVAGTLTGAHLDTERESPGRVAGLWLIRRPCEEVGLVGVAGHVRLRLRLYRRGGRRSDPTGDHQR